LTDNCNCLYFF